MKKKLLTLILVAAAFSVAFAQNDYSGKKFIGGSAKISGGVNTSESNTTSNMLINISPFFGGYITDRYSWGLSAVLGLSGNTNSSSGSGQFNFTIGVTPFWRYEVIRFGNFGLAGKLSANTGWTTGSSAFNFGLSIAPQLLYRISDKITLFSSLDCFGANLNLGYNFDSKAFNFNAGAFGDANTLASISSLSIGFFYNF